VPDDIIETLKQLVITAPTKQNEEFYSVIFLTDRNKIEEIYKFTDFDGQFKDNDFEKNSQILAPLVLVFCKETPLTNRKPEIEEYESTAVEKDQLMSIGIVSGQITLAAAQLGLKTGFCGCFNSKEVSKIVDHTKPTLLLGIGYPDSTKSRVEHQYANKIYVSYEKPITIVSIEPNTTTSKTYGLDSKQIIKIDYSHNDFLNNIDTWNNLFNLTAEDLNNLNKTLYDVFKETGINPSNSKITMNETSCTISWEGDSAQALELFKQRFMNIPLIKQIHSELEVQNWKIN
jgi:nitroreductase